MSARTSFDRGPQGQEGYFCPECDSRPCADTCSTQQTPDWLDLNAARAGLSVDEWLRRYQERHGVAWLERYPAHPAALAYHATHDAAADDDAGRDEGDGQ